MDMPQLTHVAVVMQELCSFAWHQGGVGLLPAGPNSVANWRLPQRALQGCRC